MQYRASQRGRKATTVHVGPQHAQHAGQRSGLGAVGLQQAQKTVLRQKPHIFGKHAEQATGQECSHLFGWVACGLQRFGQQREFG